MSTKPQKTHKQQNQHLLWYAVISALIGLIRPAVISAASGLITLVFVYLLSKDIKETLIFWRLRNQLPSHRWKETILLKRNQIIPEFLEEKIGQKIKNDPVSQNRAWRIFYNNVKEDPAIMEESKKYLLFRDMIPSLLFLPIIFAILSLFVDSFHWSVLVYLVFWFFPFLACIAARNAANNLVANVLVENSYPKT